MASAPPRILSPVPLGHLAGPRSGAWPFGPLAGAKAHGSAGALAIISPSVPTPPPADSGETPRKRKTTLLLEDLRLGGDHALAELLDRHLPFVREQVNRHVAKAMLARFEAEDFVQETARQILLYTPRFEVRDGEHFRNLLARMVRTSISDKWKYITAMRRDMSRESTLPGDSVLRLMPDETGTPTPSQVMSQDEDEAWVRIGLELLKDTDRLVILMREWEERSFVEIGEELGIDADAARMRHKRALGKLGKVLERLRLGEVPEED